MTVLARKPEARGMLRALGYTAVETPTELHHYRVILNTADNAGIRDLPPESLSIDLASTQGLTGENVLWARGLPGKIAPEDSGKLIARTVLRLLQ